MKPISLKRPEKESRAERIALIKRSHALLRCQPKCSTCVLFEEIEDLKKQLEQAKQDLSHEAWRRNP